MFKRGFISPLVDDLPTLIFVMITLTVFFYILNFCLTIYNEKIEMYNFNRYNVMLTSNLLANGIMSKNTLKEQLTKLKEYAKGLGYNFDACLEGEGCCSNVNSNRFIVSKYVVPWYDKGNIEPEIIKVCMW
jgi:hypothetical protein